MSDVNNHRPPHQGNSYSIQHRYCWLGTNQTPETFPIHSDSRLVELKIQEIHAPKQHPPDNGILLTSC
ncbi:MAG: hypothetical protein H7839_04550 [Magnetococcus sp. YQC-5]